MKDTEECEISRALNAIGKFKKFGKHLERDLIGYQKLGTRPNDPFKYLPVAGFCSVSCVSMGC